MGQTHTVDRDERREPARCRGARTDPGVRRRADATSRRTARCSAGCWRCSCSAGAGSCPPTPAIDALWPGTAADGTRSAALQNHLFRLRRGCPTGSSSRRPTATASTPSRIDLDADRLADASATAPGRRRSRRLLATIDAVLERWQGPAYPELADVDDGRAEACASTSCGSGRPRCGRAPARRRGDRRARRRAGGAGRRGAAARAAAGAADGGAGRDRSAASRRCGSTTTSAGCSATSSASSRRRRWPPSTPSCSPVSTAPRVGTGAPAAAAGRRRSSGATSSSPRSRRVVGRLGGW